MLSAKRNTEALMATALYETLSEADQAQLDTALKADPTLHAEYIALQKMVAAMPTQAPDYTGDLLPALREQMAMQSPVRRLRFSRLAPLVAVPLLIAMLIGGYFLQRGPVESPATPEQIVASVDAASQDPFTEIFAKVDGLMSRRKHEQATALLTESLARFPDAPSAGLAQERYAEVNFYPLQRYDVAMAAYAALRSNYADTFSNSPDSINRYDLLVEVAPADFAPLIALDKAREQGGDTFPTMEKVLAAQLPGSLMAQQTLLAMQDAVAADLPEDATAVAMLETMQERCTEPTAKGQVNLALAQRYWNDHQDLDRARLLYQEVIATGPPQVAQLAQDTLDRLPK